MDELRDRYEETRRARTRYVDGPEVRRGGREFRTRRYQAAGLFLRGREEGQSEDHHVLDIDGGPDGAAVRQGRLRSYRSGVCGRHGRHRRARPGALGYYNGDWGRVDRGRGHDGSLRGPAPSRADR